MIFLVPGNENWGLSVTFFTPYALPPCLFWKSLPHRRANRKLFHFSFCKLSPGSKTLECSSSFPCGIQIIHILGSVSFEISGREQYIIVSLHFALVCSRQKR